MMSTGKCWLSAMHNGGRDDGIDGLHQSELSDGTGRSLRQRVPASLIGGAVYIRWSTQSAGKRRRS